MNMVSIRSNIVFVTWVTATRSRVLAEFLKAEIFSLSLPTNRVLRVFIIPFLVLFTLGKLLRNRYEIVFAQIPPLSCGIATFLYAKLFGKKVIFDTHSGFFFPKEFHQYCYFLWYWFMIKQININLIHNDGPLRRNALKKTSTIVLEDKLPFNEILHSQRLLPKEDNQIQLAVICGYGKDEPINQMLETAKMFPSFKFYLTGDSRKLKLTVFEIPPNVIFTGFLPLKDYQNLLIKSDAIIALTTRPDTVLCGAYEAVSLKKPLITSDTPTLRKYFYKGTVYTKNNALSISRAIHHLVTNLKKYQQEIIELRAEKEKAWFEQFEPLNRILNEDD